MKTLAFIVAAVIIFSCISCTKEYSAETPAPATGDTTYHVVIKLPKR